MKKTIMFLGMLSLGLAHAQQNDPYDGKVGINTETPSATLNVKSKTGRTTDNTKNFELLNAQDRVLMRVWDSRKASIGTEADTDDYLNIRNLFFFNWEKRAFGTGISAATVGGWAKGYHFVTQDNATNFGGFGAYGTPNKVNYFYIGSLPINGTPIATFTYDAKNVGIGIITPTNRLHVRATEDPLRLDGLQETTDANAKNLVVVDGVVKVGAAATGSGPVKVGDKAGLVCNADNQGTISYKVVQRSGKDQGVFGFCMKKDTEYVWGYMLGGSNIFGTSANGATFGDGL